MKAMTNKAMILPFFHSYFEPPHCRASKRHMIAGMNAMVPGISNSLALAMKPRLDCFCLGGALKKKKMPTAVAAPIGCSRC